MSATAIQELNVFQQIQVLGSICQQQQAEIQEAKMHLRNMHAGVNQLMEENEQLRAMVMELSIKQQHMVAEPDGQAADCKPAEAGSTPVATSRDHTDCVQCEGTGLVGHPSWGVKCPLGK